jgi:peptidoglycan/xylan/chitin deacetylase (PgdA/CDA1 family)
MVFCSVCFALPACFLNSFQSTFFCLGRAASVLLYGFVVFCGAYFILLNYCVTAHNKAIEKSPQLSITFDDGPHENTPQILELLKKYQVKT